MKNASFVSNKDSYSSITFEGTPQQDIAQHGGDAKRFVSGQGTVSQPTPLLWNPTSGRMRIGIVKWLPNKNEDHLELGNGEGRTCEGCTWEGGFWGWLRHVKDGSGFCGGDKQAPRTVHRAIT